MTSTTPGLLRYRRAPRLGRRPSHVPTPRIECQSTGPLALSYTVHSGSGLADHVDFAQHLVYPRHPSLDLGLHEPFQLFSQEVLHRHLVRLNFLEIFEKPYPNERCSKEGVLSEIFTAQAPAGLGYSLCDEGLCFVTPVAYRWWIYSSRRLSIAIACCSRAGFVTSKTTVCARVLRVRGDTTMTRSCPRSAENSADQHKRQRANPLSVVAFPPFIVSSA